MKKLISLFVAGMMTMSAYAGDVAMVKCKATAVHISATKSFKYEDNKVVTFGITKNKQLIFSDGIIEPETGELLTRYRVDNSNIMSIRNPDIEKVTKEKYYVFGTAVNKPGELFPVVVFTCASIKLEK